MENHIQFLNVTVRLPHSTTLSKRMLEEIIACTAYHHQEMTAQEACQYLGLSTRDKLAELLKKQGYVLDARLVYDDELEELNPEEAKEMAEIIAENDYMTQEEFDKEHGFV